MAFTTNELFQILIDKGELLETSLPTIKGENGACINAEKYTPNSLACTPLKP